MRTTHSARTLTRITTPATAATAAISKAFAAAFALGLACGPANAEVIENVEYEYYDVEHEQGESLPRAITAASPIEDGFHGYTKWYVRWNYRWRYNGDGTCWITSVNVNFDATVTLPDLDTDDPRAQARFDRYIRALEGHEEGHVANGRQAAEEVAEQILEMEPRDSCSELEADANALGKSLVANANRRDKAYDRRTEHGKSEGAWITD